MLSSATVEMGYRLTFDNSGERVSARALPLSIRCISSLFFLCYRIVCSISICIRGCVVKKYLL